MNSLAFLLEKEEPFSLFNPISLYARKRIDDKNNGLARLPFYAHQFLYLPYLNFEDGILLEPSELIKVKDPEKAKAIEEEIERLSDILPFLSLFWRVSFVVF